MIDQIESLKRLLKPSLNEPHRWSGSLRRLSLARNIQGSNSIEGYEAKLDDALAIALGEEPLDTSAESQRAIEGYRNAMTFVLQICQEVEFSYSEDLLKSLHFMMTSYRLADRPGRWRIGQVFVHSEMTGEVVHEGADQGLVAPLMSELVHYLNDTSDTAIISAAMAHLNLVIVHPFKDGNGRMARCLQSLVLGRDGILSPVFMSIEEYLGRNTIAYDDVLSEVGGGRWLPDRDARAWIRFILTAHLRQATTVRRRTDETNRQWGELEKIVGIDDRRINALFDATSGLRVRRANYIAQCAEMGDEISEQTATRDLTQLAEDGLLVARGERRGRYYVAGRALETIRSMIVSERNPRDDTDPFACARP